MKKAFKIPLITLLSYLQWEVLFKMNYVGAKTMAVKMKPLGKILKHRVLDNMSFLLLEVIFETFWRVASFTCAIYYIIISQERLVGRNGVD